MLNPLERDGYLKLVKQFMYPSEKDRPEMTSIK